MEHNLAFRFSPIGMAFVKADGSFFRVNKSLCDLLEYTEEELLTKTFQELTHPQDLLEDLEFVKDCLSGKIANYSMDKRYITKTGKIVWAKLTVTILKNSNGEFEYFLSQIQNITRDKIFNEYVISAIRNGKIGVWTWLAKGDKLVWDNTMYELYDVQENEFTGKYAFFNNLVHKEDRERVAQEIGLSLKTNNEFKTKFRITLKNGDIRWLAGRGKLLVDSLGNVDVMSGINYDITEQVMLENQILEKNKDLENFAFIVSHDLREPLRTINGFSQILSMKYSNILDEKGARYLKLVVDGTKKLELIIKNILDQCRLEHEDFIKSHISMDDSLSKVLQYLGVSLAKSDVYKDFEEPGIIYMNEIHLHQILQNLISNSIKYCKPDQRPNITIQFRHDSDNYVICVKDEGIGISQENQEQLFKMFRRINKGLEGTGIGLALCKKIVDLYEGKMWMDSEVNKGTSVYISIPK